MKVNWFYIKVFVLVGVVLFLFGFAKNRNEAREIVDTKVNFEGDANLFITADTVDKLLILQIRVIISIYCGLHSYPWFRFPEC